LVRIEGAFAFVTGAAGGIGLGISTALVAAGAQVVLADRDAAAVTQAAERLGERATGIVLDVTDRAAWTEARRVAEAWGGPVDILVNNAAIGPDLHTLVEMTPDTFDLLVRIKLNGSLYGVQSFAPGMQARGCGHIVNTASMAAVTATAMLGAYTTAMFGLLGFSEVLREELAPYGVGVSALCPGRVASRLAETTREAVAMTPPSEASLERVPLPVSPSQVVIEPQDVGKMVLDAIRSNAQYVFTHGEYYAAVERRMHAVLDSFPIARLAE
jgi:NAD(P)-dependent dehydrogenase (short-subunit alcohol dehydrogenase family)